MNVPNLRLQREVSLTKFATLSMASWVFLAQVAQLVLVSEAPAACVLNSCHGVDARAPDFPDMQVLGSK